MIGIFRDNVCVLLTGVFALFSLLQLSVAKEHKDNIKEYVDRFISLKYKEFPRILAKRGLFFIDHVFGFKGDYLPRVLQIIHISFCLTNIAISLCFWIYRREPQLFIIIGFNLLIIIGLTILGWKKVALMDLPW
jgi:hypothetical protein